MMFDKTFQATASRDGSGCDTSSFSFEIKGESSKIEEVADNTTEVHYGIAPHDSTLSLPSAELVEIARRLTRAEAQRKAHVRRGLLALARGHLAQARFFRAAGRAAEAYEEIRLARGLRKSARVSR